MLHNSSMRTYHSIVAVLFLALPLLSCQPPREHAAEFFVFGTRVEVVVRDAGQQAANSAFAELQQRFQTMHRDWHAWEPGVLTGINASFASGQSVSVPQDIRILIEMSQALEIRTGGRFNAACGALVGLWGFHTSVFPINSPPPAEAEISRLVDARISANDIVLEGDMAYSRNPLVQLDFGGIAKGHAVDLALEILNSHGIHEAIINAGGDLLASGSDPARPWRVGIRRPGGGLIGGIEVSGIEAVFTSGIDQRYLQDEGNRYPHIIDPRTGQPVSGLASVTVIAGRGSYADAAATALMVGGRESWQELLQSLDLESVLLIDDEGELIMTPAMEKRLILGDEAELANASPEN